MVTNDELSAPLSMTDFDDSSIMTRRRVVELIALLQERLDEHDRLMGDR